VNGGPVVGRHTNAGPPPAMTGGTIVDGTYVLTKIELYNGRTDTGPPHQETWLFSAGTVQILEQDPTVATFSGTYTTKGNTFTLTFTCPPSFAGGMAAGSYTATATELQIQTVNGADPYEVDTYTLQ
jgi:hypothetical protein